MVSKTGYVTHGCKTVSSKIISEEVNQANNGYQSSMVQIVFRSCFCFSFYSFYFEVCFGDPLQYYNDIFPYHRATENINKAPSRAEPASPSLLAESPFPLF